MDRRAFLTWVGVGALASSLPIAIAACTSETSNTATSPAPEGEAPKVARADGFNVVGTVKDLDQAGFLQDPKFAAGPLIVVRDPADKAKLIAVNATCTHKGCPVTWSGEAKTYGCACHGSKFKPDGTVANGPAEKPLATYTVKIEEDSVLVKAS